MSQLLDMASFEGPLNEIYQRTKGSHSCRLGVGLLDMGATAVCKVQVGHAAPHRAARAPQFASTLLRSLCLTTAGFLSPSARPTLTRFRSIERQRAILTTSPQCLKTAFLDVIHPTLIGFQAMFRDRQANNKEPMIMLHNVDYDNLKALIEYMYKGEANVPQHMLSSFIRTAEMLQIRGLAEGASPPGGGGGSSSNNNKSFDNGPHHNRSGSGIMPDGSPSHHMPVMSMWDL